ncbi:hypothetical protein HYC85_006295 [Camellia sinensis]|uniref:Uncharacterized protein n=1 Tax=Camellia sinensis TaxID=4442 RepID=A0A7J7HL60_CAMSI|nr:hypothetical protein HYC85_006295 [Camellia sinensis]
MCDDGCFIMRQYVHIGEIGAIDSTMDGLTPNVYQASMVKTFVNDPNRGLRGRHCDTHTTSPTP